MKFYKIRIQRRDGDTKNVYYDGRHYLPLLGPHGKLYSSISAVRGVMTLLTKRNPETNFEIVEYQLQELGVVPYKK